MVDVPRASPYPLIPMQQALEKIHTSLQPLPPCTVDLQSALDCVLACSVHAPSPHPPFRASVKDGYAIVHSPQTEVLHVVAESVAGNAQTIRIAPSQAAYVTTGAAVPDGADTVVMVEHTKPDKDGYIKIDKYPTMGADIRQIGADIKQGELLIEKGAIIGAAEIGLLAMCGIRQVQVVNKVKVGVFSSGDELMDVQDESELPSGKIIDSNRPMLLSAVTQTLPFCKAIDLGIVEDEYETVRKALKQAMRECDIVITTGGVSMGNRDVIKPVLQELATVHFGRVLMKPGKPLTYATSGNGCVIALPGNPVSAFVCFHLAVCIAARTLGGWGERAMGSWIDVRVEHELKLDKQRPEYHRVVLKWKDGEAFATSTGKQASSRLLSARSANALLELPSGDGVVAKGDSVRAYLLGALF